MDGTINWKMNLSFALTSALVASTTAFSPHNHRASYFVAHDLNSFITKSGCTTTPLSIKQRASPISYTTPLASTATKEEQNELVELANIQALNIESVTNENNVNGNTHEAPTVTVTSESSLRAEETAPSTKSEETEERSEMEQMVSDFRELYFDLENGGGSVRREMSLPGHEESHAVRFTYVAPPTSDNYKKESNAQMYGSWRLQTPVTHDSSADWKKLHQQITEDRMAATSNVSSKPPPLLLYLPGLDGLGISATGQFDDLSSTFELWRMTANRNNVDTSFADLVNSVVSFIKDATFTHDGSPREVMLVGESFGGLLSCAVAMALNNSSTLKSRMTFKGQALVNPATSFDETNWEQLVPILTSLRYLETQEDIMDDDGNFRMRNAPQLPTPYSILGGLALSATIPDSKQYSGILDLVLRNVDLSSNEKMLAASSDGFRILAEYLPALTLEHRVTKWIPVGTSVVNNEQRLSNLHVPTLVIAGKDDNMLPTKEEANRLAKILPDCVKMDIAGSGHFVLDTRVNLTEVLIDSHMDPLDLQKNARPYDPITDWKLPPDNVVQAVLDRRIAPQRKNTAPVFFSTDPITGNRRRGLSHVPSDTHDKPILIVGNHQLFGQDLGMIISELLDERGIVARGLAHPAVSEGFGGSGREDTRIQKRRYELNEDSPFENDLFPMFGAVKVSPRNFFRLLQTNQTVLLFPGGAKEALHGKDEAYQLFWPEKTDFVRVAARFNATILPLSAIGAADSADIILDPSEMANLPFGIGDSLKNASNSTRAARFDAESSQELFVPPLAVPKPIPARHYFLFGRTFDTSNINPKDKDACLKVYQDVENEVKGGIDALLLARRDDPYALNGVRRNLYQRLFGKDPPTFPLKSLPPSRRP